MSIRVPTNLTSGAAFGIRLFLLFLVANFCGTTGLAATGRSCGALLASAHQVTRLEKAISKVLPENERDAKYTRIRKTFISRIENRYSNAEQTEKIIKVLNELSFTPLKDSLGAAGFGRVFINHDLRYIPDYLMIVLSHELVHIEQARSRRSWKMSVFEVEREAFEEEYEFIKQSYTRADLTSIYDSLIIDTMTAEETELLRPWLKDSERYRAGIIEACETNDALKKAFVKKMAKLNEMSLYVDISDVFEMDRETYVKQHLQMGYKDRKLLSLKTLLTVSPATLGVGYAALYLLGFLH